MTTCWILTEEYNAYDQYGPYLVQVFQNKPTKEQLLSCKIPLNIVNHVLNVGGRETDEDHWFYLEETILL